jgi:hypothetical protein
MDRVAADADLLFVQTTNRTDLREPALAASPGRVGVAIEIDPPTRRPGRGQAAVAVVDDDAVLRSCSSRASAGTGRPR